MEVTAKDDKVNCTLAQFQFTLGNPGLEIKRDLKRGCEQIKDPNCKVLATKYLQLYSAELIGNTALHLAASKKNLDAFGILLNLGADYTVKNHNNLTVLHQIIGIQASFISKAYSLDNTFVHLILSAHLKDSNFENPLNDNGLSHFHIACAFNNVEAVKAFVQNGIFINHTVKENCQLFPGFTALHFATKYCAVEVVQVLLSHGANIRMQTTKGMTPLLLVLEQKLKMISEAQFDEALRDKNETILMLLFEKEINSDMMIINNWGLSHFHLACTLKDSKVAECFLQKVIDINHTVNMDSSSWPGYTALHFAALCNIDAVKLLMKKGADMSIKDTKGVTPFDICIERYKAEDIYTILSLHPVWKKIMLSDGKTRLMNLVFAMRNSNQFNAFLKKFSKNFSICDPSLWPGYTPMHLAVLFAKELSSTNEDDEEINVQILRNLCTNNPNMLQIQDVHGYTPLHLSFRLHKKAVLDVLFNFLESYPNSTDHMDEDGLSFLHIASAQNNIPLLKRMLSIGSNVNATFVGKSLISRAIHPGSTALHFAVVNGSRGAAETLVRQGADVYAKDVNGMTPIHLLLLNAQAGHLLASPNLRDSVVSGIGLSHLHVACWYGSPQIVKRLLDDGADVNGVITYKPNVNEESSGSLFLKQYAGHSPLSVAHQEDCVETVQLLLQRGADIMVESTEGKALLYSVLDSKSDVYLDDFLEALKGQDDVQTRLKADTGMTALHVACLVNDDETMKKLISEGADINAQIHSDSPIYRGFTPLHVGLYLSKVCAMQKVIELLVKKGADVTLPNAASQTAVHMAYEMFDDDSEEMYSYMNMMLEGQRDFSSNPVSVSGLTHFHVACNIFNTRVVEKFLKYADIDVNQSTDYFHEDEPGYTALHLAASSLCELGTFSKQLDTIDLLLKHGADVDVEDAYGDTPLFNCLRINYTDSDSLDIFERIARAGADVNARNLNGHTPLNYYLDSGNVTSEGLKTLLRTGCCLNLFNTVTNHGYIANILSIRSIQNEDLSKLFSVLITTFRQEITTDRLGRTAIHNIVSSDQFGVSANAYASYIDQLSKTGVTVDDQANSGRTALHMAAKFHNSEGISGLLMAGANINASDNNGKTAFAYNVGTCILCSAVGESTGESKDICEHHKTIKTLAIHVKKLQFCGLDVNEQNENFMSKAFEKLKNESLLNEAIFKELDFVKNTTIGSQSLTLCEFLSETSAVADYPRMPLIQRDAINKFFSPSEVQSLREKFPELAGILQLQYRKARARPRLIELAGNALAILVEFRLPEICSDFIFVSMKNSELMNLVESTITAGNVK